MIETELDVVRDVSQRLESAGIEFMLTGSIAMNYYAEPRMTRDIDMIIKIASDQTDVILRLFKDDYYVDRVAISKAIAQRSLFNIIHNQTIFKLDCIVLKADPYRQEEFSRRRQIMLRDFQTWIVSREDLILSKLYWARDSRSEMQFRDIKNLLAADCDTSYLQSRAEMLGVKPLLMEFLNTHE
jgi:hypothetical protein